MPKTTMSLIDVKKRNHGEDYSVMYKLNTKEIKNLLERSKAKNLRVAVISVTGKVRSGKSFILDFFLRYAKRKYLEKKSNKGWMGDKDQPLAEGFSWSSGSQERDTVGIQIWPEFFICNIRGEKVCVILMDTQGSHDNESTWQEMAGIFALSTLTSSLQIYNVRNRIDDSDLSHLEKFCACTGIVTKNHSKPFQKILFLVRDWSLYNHHEFGFEGGYSYLMGTVFKEVKEPERLKTRHNVRSYFDEMACFLMPDPGEAAKSRRSFEGKLKDLSDKFIAQLDKFVPSVLSEENLVLKQVNGEYVTTGMLLDYLSWWIEKFNWANVPAMAAMVNTTAEVKRLQVKRNALELYMEKMDEFCNSRIKINEEELLEQHIEAKEAALNYYNIKAEIADEEAIRVRHKQSLIDDIEEKLVEYKEENSLKLYKPGGTMFLPCIALPMLAMCYVVDQKSMMVSPTPYKITIIVFWVSVLIMAYWTKMVCNWLLTGCTRTTIKALFIFYIAMQIYQKLWTENVPKKKKKFF